MIKAEEFMMLKDRPNQGESRGALGERRQSLPQSRFCPEKKQNFVHQNTLAYYMPPPPNFRLSYGSVMEAGGGL